MIRLFHESIDSVYIVVDGASGDTGVYAGCTVDRDVHPPLPAGCSLELVWGFQQGHGPTARAGSWLSFLRNDLIPRLRDVTIARQDRRRKEKRESARERKKALTTRLASWGPV